MISIPTGFPHVYNSYTAFLSGIPWNIPQVTCIFSVYTLLASISQYRLWNSAMRVCRGTSSCVAVEANPRFAVSAATLTYMKADAGRGSRWSCW